LLKDSVHEKRVFSMINQVKWFSAIVLSIGLVLTSANIYPQNLYVQIVGITGWLYAGILTEDKPLIYINFVGLIILLAGIWYSWNM
jgi:uncharacterized protein with PQ loop repeat